MWSSTSAFNSGKSKLSHVANGYNTLTINLPTLQSLCFRRSLPVKPAILKKKKVSLWIKDLAGDLFLLHA